MNPIPLESEPFSPGNSNQLQPRLYNKLSTSVITDRSNKSLHSSYHHNAIPSHHHYHLQQQNDQLNPIIAIKKGIETMNENMQIDEAQQ